MTTQSHNIGLILKLTSPRPGAQGGGVLCDSLNLISVSLYLGAPFPQVSPCDESRVGR